MMLRPPPLRDEKTHLNGRAYSYAALAPGGTGHTCLYCNTYTMRVRVAGFKKKPWRGQGPPPGNTADVRVLSCLDEECMQGALVDLSLRLEEEPSP